MGVKQLAKRLPFPVQQSAKYIYGFIPARIRYGKVFRDTYDFLQKSQWWSKEKLQEYQMQQLSALLHHAYENVPYYRRVFDERGLKPKDIHDFDGLRKIPLLTKEIIREHLEEFRAVNFPPLAFIKATTGGSIGTPLGFYCQRDFSSPRELAFIYTLWGRVGFRINDKRLVLSGSVVEEHSKVAYNPATKEIVCSTYNMDKEHLLSYFQIMQQERIKFIHGHISSIVLLAHFLLRNGLSYNGVQAVLGASEKVFPFQREIVRKAFNTRLFSWYGQSEQVALAGECEYSDLYHIFPEYGVLELIDENGKIIDTPGKAGEIVGTGFNNDVMPFIRYKTGDIGIYSARECKCNREYDVLKEIEGRCYEYIVTKDETKISLTGLIFGQHFEAFEHIEKMQMYQEQAGEVEIRIVKSPDYTRKDEVEIEEVIQRAVSHGLNVKFVYVTEIPLTKRGKHKFLIQELPVGFDN